MDLGGLTVFKIEPESYDPAVHRVLVLNGPNLDRLGRRRPEVYGSSTLAELEDLVTAWGAEDGVEVTTRQSNHEGELVEALHAADGAVDGVAFNPGALTHTSAALHDAVESITAPVVEVHISNPRARSAWRHYSRTAPACVAQIFGRGLSGYRWGLRHLVNRAAWDIQTIRYGPHPDQIADLRRVPGATSGAILVHGGFWGDAWGRDLVDGWGVALARTGIESAAIEFRRLGSGGGHPATFSDTLRAVESALDHLRSARHVLVGHASGGHLALWAAGHPGEGLAGVVAVSPVPDLVTAAAQGLGDEAPGRLAPGVDPALVSPAHRLPLGRAQVLVHGAADSVVPASHSQAYAAAARSAGDPVTLDVVEDAGHLDFLEVGGDPWKRVESAVVQLVDNFSRG